MNLCTPNRDGVLGLCVCVCVLALLGADQELDPVSDDAAAIYGRPAVLQQ